MLQNIPDELKALPQWVVAYNNKIPLNPETGLAASVSDPRTWGTFDLASSRIPLGVPHVGFVLTPNDPYSIIDLDNKLEKPCSPEEAVRHARIVDYFDTYIERSASKRGYHIVLKGKIPTGIHRDKVEIYSSGRYMIFTGDVVKKRPIKDAQAELTSMYAEMQPPKKAELNESVEQIEDEDLIAMAMRASNGIKFNQLCNGSWKELGYPSQSEADYALLSMFAFYSKSNAQVRRLFRMTALGKREKVQKDDRYLNFALTKIRANEPAMVDIQGLQMKAYEAAAVAAREKYELAKEVTESGEIKIFPQGLVGDVAQYILETSIRPVPEIALAASLGFLAGIAGRCYNVSETGLNQYLILIAKTGTGKEGAISGINRLAAAIRPTVPMIDEFIGPAAFASGQSLIKVLDERPCFVSVLGEFGLTLQQLCDKGANERSIMMRKVLLDLYTKSGHTSTLRSTVYSDTDKNTKTICSPAVTLLGETTPETFFNGLDASHIAEGLIPRFTSIYYSGERRPRNTLAGAPPKPELVSRLCELVTIALASAANSKFTQVQITPGAQDILDHFDRECDAKINASLSEVDVQLWNRAHLKALKLAGIAAVGFNPHDPSITGDIAKWAIHLVRLDAGYVCSRFMAGDVGQGDSKQLIDLQRCFDAYAELDPKTASHTYNIAPSMMKDQVVPYSFISRRTFNMVSFHNDKLGSTAALKRALQTLIDTGVIVEIPPVQVQARYAYHGKAYMRIRVPR